MVYKLKLGAHKKCLKVNPAIRNDAFQLQFMQRKQRTQLSEMTTAFLAKATGSATKLDLSVQSLIPKPQTCCRAQLVYAHSKVRTKLTHSWWQPDGISNQSSAKNR